MPQPRTGFLVLSSRKPKNPKNKKPKNQPPGKNQSKAVAVAVAPGPALGGSPPALESCQAAPALLEGNGTGQCQHGPKIQAPNGDRAHKACRVTGTGCGVQEEPRVEMSCRGLLCSIGFPRAACSASCTCVAPGCSGSVPRVSYCSRSHSFSDPCTCTCNAGSRRARCRQHQTHGVALR